MNPKLKLEINNITNQIVKKYNPQRIILYGSTAIGRAKSDSDLDLLIIKNTTQDPIRRVQVLSSLIDRTVPCDFLVYTPQEIKKRLTLGDFFIKEILEQGKIMYETS